MRKIGVLLLVVLLFTIFPREIKGQNACPADRPNTVCDLFNPDETRCVAVGACDDVNTQYCCSALPGPTCGGEGQACCPVGGIRCSGIGLTCQSNVCRRPGSGGEAGSVLQDCGINTAIGCIPIGSETELVGFILRWAIGIGGGIAFLLILVAGFQIMTSTGDPKKLQAGQELLTSAIGGLLLLIFSVFILRVIGVDILGLF